MRLVWSDTVMTGREVIARARIKGVRERDDAECVRSAEREA